MAICDSYVLDDEDTTLINGNRLINVYITHKTALKSRGVCW